MVRVKGVVALEVHGIWETNKNLSKGDLSLTLMRVKSCLELKKQEDFDIF